MEQSEVRKLLDEVISRGFGPGVIFSNDNIYSRGGKNITITDFEPVCDGYIIDVIGVGGYGGRHTIWKNGVWAEIIHNELDYEIY